MDFAVLVAFVLLLLGVLGSVTPTVPGALFSIIGVLYYWFSTGYTSPGTFFVAGTVVAGTFALMFDWFGGAISAKAGGASTKTVALSGVTGFLLFFVAGPVGLLAGIVLGVFIRESLRTGETGKSVRSSIYATLGILASGFIQILITAGILLAFLATFL